MEVDVGTHENFKIFTIKMSELILTLYDFWNWEHLAQIQMYTAK